MGQDKIYGWSAQYYSLSQRKVAANVPFLVWILLYLLPSLLVKVKRWWMDTDSFLKNGTIK
jgi:hypothetical protein